VSPSPTDLLHEQVGGEDQGDGGHGEHQLSYGSVGGVGDGRPDPDGGGTQLAVRVTGAAWVGKLPARVWIRGPGTLCQDCADLDPVRLGEKGSQWVVMVRDADAKLIDAWPVYGGGSRSPGPPAADRR
jgi:hypothetical protein